MAVRRVLTATCALLRQHGCHRTTKRSVCTSSKRLSIYEDESLTVQPDVPDLPELTLRLRGYDFVVLESFSKYMHNFLLRWNCDADYFPVPARSWSVKTYLPKSAVVDQQFDITKYERAIKVEGITAPRFSLMLDVLQQQMPAGVELEITEANEADDEILYINDKELQDLQGQLQAMIKAKGDAKKKQ